MSAAAKPDQARRFAVHTLAETRGQGRLVEGDSFEDAALSFVEERHLGAGPDGEVALIVEDCDSGEQQCFRIDLASGAAEPCE